MDTTATTLAPVKDLIAEYEASRQTPASSPGSDVSKEVFLKLLVAQIRNQNPLNPADSIEFLTQLAEFTALEQMIGIREEVAGLRADLAAPLPDPAAEPDAETEI